MTIFPMALGAIKSEEWYRKSTLRPEKWTRNWKAVSGNSPAAASTDTRCNSQGTSFSKHGKTSLKSTTARVRTTAVASPQRRRQLQKKCDLCWSQAIETNEMPNGKEVGQIWRTNCQTLRSCWHVFTFADWNIRQLHIQTWRSPRHNCLVFASICDEANTLISLLILLLWFRIRTFWGYLYLLQGAYPTHIHWRSMKHLIT